MRAIVLGSLVVAACVLAGGPTQAASRPPSAPALRAEEVRPALPEGWDAFQSQDGLFSIFLPTHRRTAEAEDDGIPVHIVQARAEDGCEYAVVWSESGDAGTAAALPALLSAIAEGRGISTEYGSLEAGQDRRSGLNGRKIRGASEKSEMDLRAFTDGRRLFKLYATCAREMATDTKGREHSIFEFAAGQRRAFFGSFVVEETTARN